MMRVNIQVIEGNNVSRKNPQQGADDAGVRQHENIAVTRLPQGTYGRSTPTGSMQTTNAV